MLDKIAAAVWAAFFVLCLCQQAAADVYELTVGDGDELRLRFEGLQGPQGPAGPQGAKGDPGVCPGPCTPEPDPKPKPDPKPPVSTMNCDGAVNSQCTMQTFEELPVRRQNAGQRDFATAGFWTNQYVPESGKRDGSDHDFQEVTESRAHSGAKSLRFVIPPSAFGEHGTACTGLKNDIQHKPDRENYPALRVREGEMWEMGAWYYFPTAGNPWPGYRSPSGERCNPPRLMDWEPLRISQHDGHKSGDCPGRCTLSVNRKSAWGGMEEGDRETQAPKDRWVYLAVRIKLGDSGSALRDFDPNAAGWIQLIFYDPSVHDEPQVTWEATTRTMLGSTVPGHQVEVGLTITSSPAEVYMDDFLWKRVAGPR